MERIASILTIPLAVFISDPVQLDSKSLPWVEHAEHLGHTLHQTVTSDIWELSQTKG